MSARAQLILKQLGISPWVERASATDIIANQMLWRDQSDDQGIEDKKLSFTEQTMCVEAGSQFVQNQSHKTTAPQTIVEKYFMKSSRSTLKQCRQRFILIIKC